MPTWTRDPAWPKGLFRRENGTFYLRRQHDGVRLTKTLGTENLARAIELVTKANAGVEERGLTLRQSACQGNVSFGDAATSYIERPNRPLRPNSIKEYSRAVEHLHRGLCDILGVLAPPLRAITNAIVQQYIDARLAAPKATDPHPNTPKAKRGPASAKTVRCEVELLKGILRHAAQRGMLDREPIIDATVRDGSVKRYGGLSARACPLHNPADIRRLLDAARDYDQRQPEGWWPWPTYFTDIISGYLYLGLRDQELVHLEWNDVDLAMRTVRIRQKQVVCTRRITLGEAAVKLAASLAKGRSPKARLVGEGEDLPTVGRILHVQDEGLLRGLRVADFNAEKGTLMVRDEYQWQPKGYEGKPIPIPPPLFEILNRMSHHRSSNFVYPDRDQGYRKFHFDRVLKEIVAAAGLPSGFRTHDLRHSYAVQLRRSGARLETIKELMRHAMIEDTLVYAVYDDGEGSAAVSKLSFG